MINKSFNGSEGWIYNPQQPSHRRGSIAPDGLIPKRNVKAVNNNPEVNQIYLYRRRNERFDGN